MERVVITGMGVVSPIGNNVDKFWRNLTEGNRAFPLLIHLT